MQDALFSTDGEFEDEVRRVARLLWPRAEFDGAVIAEERERDGVFVTEEAVHLVECTTSRTKEKAEKDVGKLAKLANKVRSQYPTKAVKGWFVTLEEPTAHQRTVVHSHQHTVVAVSFDQFRSRLIDARA